MSLIGTEAVVVGLGGESEEGRRGRSGGGEWRGGWGGGEAYWFWWCEKAERVERMISGSRVVVECTLFYLFGSCEGWIVYPDSGT